MGSAHIGGSKRERRLMMHPLFLLPAATFVLLIAVLGWNFLSTKRSQETGGKSSGIGGPNDPMA